MAKLQGHFMRSANNPEMAVENIKDLFEEADEMDIMTSA